MLALIKLIQKSIAHKKLIEHDGMCCTRSNPFSWSLQSVGHQHWASDTADPRVSMLTMRGDSSRDCMPMTSDDIRWHPMTSDDTFPEIGGVS